MSILDQWQDRWNFAVFNNEQRYQTQLVTKRRFFNAVVALPLNRIQNKLLRPDVEAKGFDAAAYKFVEDVFIGAGAGQLTRSLIFAYGNNKDFRDVLSASRVLEGFGMAAEVHDDAPRSLGEEISTGRSSAMYDLVNHSNGASDLLDKFVHNELEMTPTNVARLERHLHALAQVCDEKATMMEAFHSLRDPSKIDETKPPKPTDYIRDVMEADEITTPRQAQIMAGFVSAVLVEAAQPLGTEIFVPQDKQYLTPEQTVSFSNFISEQLELRGLVPNVSLDGTPRPFTDLPEGAMVKAQHDGTGKITGYEKISRDDAVAFGNAIHSHIKRELGTNLEAMLSFVDSNFDEVEKSIARSKEDPTPISVAAWNSPAEAAKVQDVENPDKWREKTPNALDLLTGVHRVVKTAGTHLTRAEAMYENKKLFGRALAAQILSFPVRIVDEAMKSFLRPGKGFDMIVEAAKTGEAHGTLIDVEDLTNNVQSNTFRLFTAPVAASFGTVTARELAELPKGIAIEAAGRASRVLQGAIRAGHQHAPQVAERMDKIRNGQHPSLQAVLEDPKYRDNIARISQTPPDQRSDEDYKLLGQYYRDLGDICVSTAEEALSPFGVKVSPEKIDSMSDVVSRVLRRRVENVPDAMVAMAFVQTFLEVSAKKTSSVEFVDPRQLLIKHRDMGKLSNFIDKQAEAAGLTISKGEEVKGVEAGQLLEKDENGALIAAKPQTLVRFANVIVNEMKHYVDLDLLMAAARGEFKAEYMNPVEAKVFGENTFEVTNQATPATENGLDASGKNDDKEADPNGVPKELTERWTGRVSRKKSGLLGNLKQSLSQDEVQHEVRKLFDRSKGEAVSAFLPSLLYNSLQHNESIVNRSAIASAVYKTVIYPVLYSKGMVTGKETLNEIFTKKRAVVNEADVSRSLIEGAITVAGSHDPDMREKLMASNQVNAALMELEGRPEFHDVPRVAAKPRDERTPEDDNLIEQFCGEIGTSMVDVSTRILGSLGEGYQGESVQKVIERVLDKPVDNVQDAVIALSFLHSAMSHTIEQLDILRFIDPDDKFLDRKSLGDLTEYMNDQAAKAGFAVHGVQVKGHGGNDFAILGQDPTLKEGELLQWDEQTQSYDRAPAESIIRFANLAMAKFHYLEEEMIQEKGAGRLAARYQNETKGEIFTRL